MKELRSHLSEKAKKSAKRKKHTAYKRELASSVWEKKGVKMDELRYEGRTAGILVIPEELNYSGKYLTHGEKALWLAIFSHNWSPDQRSRVSWPGVERLALMIGVTTRQALTYLKGLREKDLLLTRRRQDKSSLMVLLDPPKEWMEKTKKRLDKEGKKKTSRKKTR